MVDRPFPTDDVLAYSSNLRLLGDDGTKPGDVLASMFARKVELHAVALSGDYNDLTNKPAAGDADIAIADVTGLAAALSGKAATAHSHAAGDITSGVINVARLGTGTAGATKVLFGDGAWKDAPTGGVGGTEEVDIANNSFVGVNNAGDFVSLANIRLIPVGIENGAAADAMVFKGPPMPWPYTVLGLTGRVEGTGSPSLTVTAKIGATAITGLTSVAFTPASVARVDATGANAGAAGTEPSVTVVGAPVGTLTRSVFYIAVRQEAA